MFSPKISSIFRGCESDIYGARFREPPPCSKVHPEFTRSSDLHLDALCLEYFLLSLCVVCSGAAAPADDITLCQGTGGGDVGRQELEG